MTTPLTSIFYFVLASLLGAIGQFLYKGGADSAQGSLVSYIANVRILGGVVCYIAGMGLLICGMYCMGR